MAFATINYFSHSLKKASSFNVVFPDDPTTPRPWSVFYLLHGLSDDHTIWMRRTSIERYVAGLPLVVVMPDGGRGWYTNAVEGVRLRGRPDQGRHRPDRADLPRQGRARRPGDRRALDGRLRRGQARAEAPRAVRQRQLALRARSGSSADPRRAGAQPRVRADLRRVAQGRPRGPVRDRRTDRPRPHPGAPDRLRRPKTSCSTRTARSTSTWKRCTSPRIPGVPRRPRLGLLGPARSGGHRVPRQEPGSSKALRQVSETAADLAPDGHGHEDERRTSPMPCRPVTRRRSDNEAITSGHPGRHT